MGSSARILRRVLPVSVVIPAYNRPAMTRRAVVSALAQVPEPPAEVIVVDDASSDGTGAAAAEAGARVIRHEHNRGEAGARNTGVEAARQPWIALLDSDDEWLPNCLATLWPYREGNVLVGGASLIRGPAGDRYGGVLGGRPARLRSPAALVYPENFIAASGTLARREDVRVVGGYREGLRQGADMDLWIRLLERGPGIVLPEPVVVYHVHAGQVTQDSAAMASGHRAVASRYAGRAWWSSTSLERWEGGASWDAARRAWRTGRRLEAARGLVSLLRRPVRLSGALGILVRRARLRRRGEAIARP